MWGLLPSLGNSKQVMVLPCGEANTTYLGLSRRLGHSVRSGCEETLDEGKATFESRQYSEYSRLTIRKPKSWN